VKKQIVSVASPALPVGLRRFLFATAATTGAAIMIVEILGAKMLAPYIGTSHFVWTAQIAVTLVALSLGYAAGGWLVDRSPRLRWIYFAIVGAALALGVGVLSVESVAYACLRFKLAVGSLLASATLFFVPLALLAMVGPFFARMLTASVESVGSNVGRLTAISTLGSVAGTILIGYLLLPHLPNTMTMFLTAAALVVVAVVYFLVWDRRGAPPAVLGSLLAMGLGFLATVSPLLSQPSGYREVYRRNSDFGLMQVVDFPAAGRRFYLNDLLTQNTYEPEKRRSASLFTHLLHGLANIYTPRIEDALCVGMGIGIVPMQFARAGVRVEVVEINEAVVPIAQRYFDFEPDRVTLHIGDGRYFAAAGTNQFDTIILDAFLGESPPGHLMTREALGAMKRRLRPGGTLVMNTFGEFQRGRDFFLASLDQTLRAVFQSVRIHASGNGNVFFVAADVADLRPLRAFDLSGVPPFLHGEAEAAIAGLQTVDREHGIVLTDDFNPVDFHDAVNREDLRKRLALGSRAH
jgi:spermidine synthase